MSDKPQAPDPQLTPRDWSRVPWVGGDPQTAPTQTTDLSSVLADPARAQFVYHPTERFEDPAGWAGERLLFLGVDNRWRVLSMADLGLPSESWPGPDTYGSGSLSSDGRRWAGKANGGVILLDLTTGAVQFIDSPPGHPYVSFVQWVPGQDVVSAYASGPNSRGFETFHVNAAGQATPVRYPGSRTRFDVDGTPVEVSGSGRDELQFKRYNGDRPDMTIFSPGAPVPRLMRDVSFGTFGASEVALYAHRGWPSTSPAQVWVLSKRTGHMTARLQVPASTSPIDWADEDTLRLLFDNRRVIEWQPRTGEVQRVVELPGPYPLPGQWAAVTVAFPSLS